MSKKEKFKIEINFTDGTTREDIEDICAMWHAKQIKRIIGKMPTDLARKVISEIDEIKTS